MEHSPPLGSPSSKSELYLLLAKQLQSLFEGETDGLANISNMTALVYSGLPEVNWAGFYFFKGGQLVLGPFQGKPACTRIAPGKGVCGMAAAQRRSVVTPNVHEFPGHIACDSASASEIVVPIVVNGDLLGVFDVDSPTVGRFDDEDRVGMESLVAVFVDALCEWSAVRSLFCD